MNRKWIKTINVLPEKQVDWQWQWQQLSNLFVKGKFAKQNAKNRDFKLIKREIVNYMIKILPSFNYIGLKNWEEMKPTTAEAPSSSSTGTTTPKSTTAISLKKAKSRTKNPRKRPVTGFSSSLSSTSSSLSSSSLSSLSVAVQNQNNLVSDASPDGPSTPTGATSSVEPTTPTAAQTTSRDERVSFFWKIFSWKCSFFFFLRGFFYAEWRFTEDGFLDSSFSSFSYIFVILDCYLKSYLRALRFQLANALDFRFWKLSISEKNIQKMRFNYLKSFFNTK